ncbi:MAG: DNA polymerase III subunit delta [Plesiomonas sp.]|uniref:DNA polymerase III subunit delta n=1 Tax=Plesiomonas sp. TaxID=2486279 RepID=UPI003F349004
MNKIFPEQLTTQLKSGLRPCYFLLGNDPLLLQESADTLREQARSQEFNERHSFTLDNRTDWESIYQCVQAMSLFSARQIIELVLPEGGPGTHNAEPLVQLATLLHPDILLLIQGNKLTKAQENSKWFKALSPQATLISCQTPELPQLPKWVATRAKKLALQLDDASIQVLCHCYEGNLLALSQALERLKLLFPDGKLTLPRVESAVNQSSHFTPYHWVDALLEGKVKRALRIIEQLKNEDVEPVILLRTVQRELMLLFTLHTALQHAPQPYSHALRLLFDQHKIWQNRRPLLTHALQRLTHVQLGQQLHQLAMLERMVKQDYSSNVWPALRALSCSLCGHILTLPDIQDMP